jgi:hypothetical protein
MAGLNDEEIDERMNLTIGVTFFALVAAILLIFLYKPKVECEMSGQRRLSQADVRTEMQVRELMRELERNEEN